MSVPASTVITTSRTLLNDDAATLWTDPVLLPKLTQAHRELQAMLRVSGAPVMRKSYFEALGANVTAFAAQPLDMLEPIRLYEGSHLAAQSTFTPMTEADPLPLIAPSAASLTYWQWLDEIVTFIGCTTPRDVLMYYWRIIPTPVANTDLIGMLNGELWLAPRVAALAAQTTANKDLAAQLTEMAGTAMKQVILANRGRMPPGEGTTLRP